MSKPPVRQYTHFPETEEPGLFEMIVRTAGLIAILIFLVIYFWN